MAGISEQSLYEREDIEVFSKALKIVPEISDKNDDIVWFYTDVDNPRKKKKIPTSNFRRRDKGWGCESRLPSSRLYSPHAADLGLHLV